MENELDPTISLGWVVRSSMRNFPNMVERINRIIREEDGKVVYQKVSSRYLFITEMDKEAGDGG